MPVTQGKSGFPIKWKVPSQKVSETFRDADDVLQYLQGEQSFWGSLRGELVSKQALPDHLAGYFDGPVSTIKAALDSIQPGSAPEDVAEVLIRLERAAAPLSKGTIGIVATTLTQTAPHLVPGLMLLHAARDAAQAPVIKLDQRRLQSLTAVPSAMGAVLALMEERISGRSDAAVLAATLEGAQTLRSELAAEKTEFEQWNEETRSAWYRDLESFRSDMGKALSSTEEELKHALADHRQRIEAMEKKVLVDLAVQAPTTYWKGKATSHFRIASIAGVTFILILGGGLGWLMASGADFIADATRIVLNPDAPSTAVFLPIVFVSVPALAIAWVLRHVSRVIVQNLALGADAQLRGTIATTYRALTAERPPTEAETAIVLQALFRPLDGSGHSEIEPPTLPDIMKMTKP